MSIWSTYDSEIKNSLKSLGYEEQPDNFNIDDPDASNEFIHFGFSIKVLEIDRQSITDGHAYHTYLVELKISYLNAKLSRSSNLESFDDLCALLINNGAKFPNFVSLSENPTFTDDDISNQTTIGTIRMWYGVRGC